MRNAIQILHNIYSQKVMNCESFSELQDGYFQLKYSDPISNLDKRGYYQFLSNGEVIGEYWSKKELVFLMPVTKTEILLFGTNATTKLICVVILVNMVYSGVALNKVFYVPDFDKKNLALFCEMLNSKMNQYGDYH